MSFKDWLYGAGGTPGNYDYKLMHLLSVVIIFLLTLVLIYFAVSKRYSGKNKKIILYSIAIFQLIFEVVWRIVFLARGDSLASLWPLYACNLNGILVPLAVLCKSKTLKKMFYLFGFVGGLITFAMPQGIFNNAYLTFPILKSILQHTSLIFIPVFEYASGTFRPKLKDFWLVIVGLVIHLINAFGIAALLKRPGDYLYLQGDLPFVIPHIPQYITMSVTAIVALLVLNMLLDLKAFRRKPDKKKIAA